LADPPQQSDSSGGVTVTRATRTADDGYHADAALNGVCDKIGSGEPYPLFNAGIKADFDTEDRRQGEQLTAQTVNEVSHSQDLATHEFCRRLHRGTPALARQLRIRPCPCTPRVIGYPATAQE
jgi:hypothetical protein